MLQVVNVTKNFGGQPVLRDVSFMLNAGERAGLVGSNGSGKSTLLRIIAGQEPADSGQVQLTGFGGMGYLAQALPFAPEETVQQVLDRAMGEHTRAWAAMQQAAEQMSQTTEPATLAQLTTAYAKAETRFEAAGGYGLPAALAAALSALELDSVPPELAVAHLSGGQKTRLALAGLLVQQPRLLLLDEPTNHLDLAALDWLTGWLAAYDGAVLVVSHDRAWLDEVTTRTLALDPVSHTLQDFAGNYSAFVEHQAQTLDQQWQAYQAQQQEITHLRHTAQQLRGLAHFRRGGKADTNDKFAKGFFGNRSAGTMGRAKQIERRLEHLQTEGRLDKPGRQWGLRLEFAAGDDGARQVLQLTDVGLAFGRRWLLRQINLTVTHGERIALVGPNGSGKTSLLRLIAGQLSPTSGTVRLGAGVRLGYMTQEQDTLDPQATPLTTLQAVAALNETDTRRLLHQFLFAGDEVFVPVGQLSFGERARLMLARLVVEGCNLLLLDEPLNHMDLTSRERFEVALTQFGGTILTAGHDRMFMERVATGMWTIAAGGIRVT
ncbi:MAG: putative ABC transporter ATP-binding protein YheS [Anaerolineae bacterium]|nr:putative ABC transporter ATP-binding protein YheS [Anaerolineae bacterium]